MQPRQRDINVVGVKDVVPEDGHEDNQDHERKVKTHLEKTTLKILIPGRVFV